MVCYMYGLKPVSQRASLICNGAGRLCDCVTCTDAFAKVSGKSISKAEQVLAHCIGMPARSLCRFSRDQ